MSVIIDDILKTNLQTAKDQCFAAIPSHCRDTLTQTLVKYLIDWESDKSWDLADGAPSELEVIENELQVLEMAFEAISDHRDLTDKAKRYDQSLAALKALRESFFE